MKKNVVTCLIVVCFFLGILLGYNISKIISIPDQDIYWYDEMLKIFRKIPKGFLDESNHKRLWFTQNDIDSKVLDKRYRDYVTALDKIQAYLQYRQQHEGETR